MEGAEWTLGSGTSEIEGCKRVRVGLVGLEFISLEELEVWLSIAFVL